MKRDLGMEGWLLSEGVGGRLGGWRKEVNVVRRKESIPDHLCDHSLRGYEGRGMWKAEI